MKTFFFKCSNSGRNESTPQTQNNVSWILSKAELEILFLNSLLEMFGFKKAGRLENYTLFVDEMLAKMDTTLQGMKDTACLAEFKSHLSKAKVVYRLQEVLARSWSLHAIISAKRHLEENAAQAGIQQQMQEKRIQHKEKDNLVVDEILARVNEPQGTLSQMLHAYNKKSELESITIDTESI